MYLGLSSTFEADLTLSALTIPRQRVFNFSSSLSPPVPQILMPTPWLDVSACGSTQASCRADVDVRRVPPVGGRPDKPWKSGLDALVPYVTFQASTCHPTPGQVPSCRDGLGFRLPYADTRIGILVIRSCWSGYCQMIADQADQPRYECFESFHFLGVFRVSTPAPPHLESAEFKKLRDKRQETVQTELARGAGLKKDHWKSCCSLVF